jgi:ABC-type Fe3+/spermidine/putrescine transport system ATPase subunit
VRSDDVLRLTDVRKTYGNRVHALAGVTLGFTRGTFTAVMGPSGSGKSTFLHCAAGLDRPTSGSVLLDGHELTGMKERALTELRRDRIGFVFQAFNLVPTLTVTQNVIIRLQPVNGVLHDFMLIDPTTNVPFCWFGIWDNNRGKWAYGSESGAESQPIPDGPGESLQGWVATWNGSAWVDWASGPSN